MTTKFLPWRGVNAQLTAWGYNRHSRFSRNKILAGVLGYTTEGLIMLLVTLVGGIITCGLASAAMGIVGLIKQRRGICQYPGACLWAIAR